MPGDCQSDTFTPILKDGMYYVTCEVSCETPDNEYTTYDGYASQRIPVKITATRAEQLIIKKQPVSHFQIYRLRSYHNLFHNLSGEH